MYIEVAAHRGNVCDYPENTMPAYRSAYEIGADMIELDLQMTKDGEIVLIHDPDLERTSDVSGKIRELNYDEILRADVGIKRGEAFKGIRVPTLRQFCELAVQENPTMQFNFEFKDYFTNLYVSLAIINSSLVPITMIFGPFSFLEIIKS